jgi:hypothetical protein
MHQIEQCNGLGEVSLDGPVHRQAIGHEDLLGRGGKTQLPRPRFQL